MGALTREQKYQITYMGRIICSLPCDVNTGKMIIFSTMFDCLYESLILGSIYQQDKSIFRYRNEIGKKYISVTQSYGLKYDSDDIMYLNVYFDWYY